MQAHSTIQQAISVPPQAPQNFFAVSKCEPANLVKLSVLLAANLCADSQKLSLPTPREANMPATAVNVRYMVDDVDAAVPLHSMRDTALPAK
jgi:hypothetical protein